MNTCYLVMLSIFSSYKREVKSMTFKSTFGLQRTALYTIGSLVHRHHANNNRFTYPLEPELSAGVESATRLERHWLINHCTLHILKVKFHTIFTILFSAFSKGAAVVTPFLIIFQVFDKNRAIVIDKVVYFDSSVSLISHYFIICSIRRYPAVSSD